MIKFIKHLPTKKAIPAYLMLLFALTILGCLFSFGWYGLKLSIPTTLTILIIDLFLTYLKHKRWEKN